LVWGGFSKASKADMTCENLAGCHWLGQCRAGELMFLFQRRICEGMAHRKMVRHFHEVGHLHELTFSCYCRTPLLTNDSWREKLARCLEAANEESAMNRVGYIFMPEHVHLLVYPTIPNPSSSRYLARIKQPFSKQIKEMQIG
jgi:hypothetical protein